MNPDPYTENPATLVAVIVAARRSGNRELERSMRRKLEQQFQVKVRFAQETRHGEEDRK